MAVKVTRKSGSAQGDTEQIKKQLIDLLEFEINRIHSEKLKPGWTPWALIAGIASAFWLLTIELENDHYSWVVSFFVFLGFWICYETLEQGRLIFNIPSNNKRFDLINQQHLTLLLIIISRLGLFIALIVIASKFSNILGWLFSISIYAFVGTTILWYLLIALVVELAINVFQLPMISEPKTIDNNYSKIIAWIQFGLGGFSVFEIVRSVWLGLVIPTPVEYRIGGILFGAGFMFLILINQPLESPIGDTLVQIRRNLGLGKLEIEAAKKEIEIAVIGLSVPILLQREFAIVLEMQQEMLNKFQVGMEEFHKAVNIAVKPKLSKQQELLFNEAIEKHSNNINACEVLMKKSKRKIIEIQFKLPIYIRLSPESKSEILELLDQVSSVLDENGAASEIIIQQSSKDLKRFNRSLEGQKQQLES